MIVFACHPEFVDYEVFQAKSTQELVDFSAKKLQSDEVEQSLAAAHKSGIQVIMGLTEFGRPQKSQDALASTE